MILHIIVSSRTQNSLMTPNFGRDAYVDRLIQRNYRGADKSLTRPGKKQAQKHVRDARDFNNIETRAIIKFFFLQG